MNALINACVVGAVLISAVNAQQASKPVMRPGVSVQMAVAEHAVEMRAADEENAIVVAITAEGKMFVGITPAEAGALSGIAAETVYLKADSRAPFQRVAAALDALRGKSVVLLTAAPAGAPKTEMPMPPYGIRLAVSR
jgi:biopolymer transport protein ExbD